MVRRRLVRNGRGSRRIRVFEGDWGIMAGDWRPNPNWHNGTLKPVSDAAHALGMKFLVWVEPCRAIHGRPITLEHPEYFLTGNADGKIRKGQTLLLDLGKPESLKWAIDVVRRSGQGLQHRLVRRRFQYRTESLSGSGGRARSFGNERDAFH